MLESGYTVHIITLSILKTITNSISIIVVIGTFIYIWEKWMRGQKVLHTHNKKLTFFLMFLGLGMSISNLFLPISTEFCNLIRHFEKFHNEYIISIWSYNILSYLLSYAISS